MNTTSPAASDAAKASQATNRAAGAQAAPKAPVDALFAALLDQALVDPKLSMPSGETVAAEATMPKPGSEATVETAAPTADTASVMAQLGLLPPTQAMQAAVVPGTTSETLVDAELPIDAGLGKGLGRAQHLGASITEDALTDPRSKPGAITDALKSDDPALAFKASAINNPLTAGTKPSPIALPALDLAALAGAADDVVVTTSATAPNPLAASQPPSLATPRADAALNLPALPVQHPAFGQRLGETVNWMMDRGLQEADIRISPENLGPVRIKLRMEGQDAVVSFVVPQDSTRQAIEQNLDALRQALSQAGVTLGETTVSAHSGQQTEQGAGQHQGRGQRGGDAPSDETAVASMRRITVPAGRVDLFA